MTGVVYEEMSEKQRREYGFLPLTANDLVKMKLAGRFKEKIKQQFGWMDRSEGNRVQWSSQTGKNARQR